MTESHVAQKGQYVVELRAGHSTKQPFCDGSHQSTTLTPVVFKAEQDGTAYLCRCKQTGTQPYCDGSHNQL
jgi:CDGSH-type Zn-finger protein